MYHVALVKFCFVRSRSTFRDRLVSINSTFAQRNVRGGDPGLGLAPFFLCVHQRVEQFAIQGPPLVLQPGSAIQLLGSVPKPKLNDVLGPKMQNGEALRLVFDGLNMSRRAFGLGMKAAGP